MASTDYKSVDEYIAAQPAAAQAVLQRVRGILRKALPGAEEKISYQIPTYRLHGAAVVYFAGWKEHYSLYPVGELVAKTFEKELSGYRVAKGTIRFPLSEPVPSRLIEGIAKTRANEAAERLQAKKAAPKKPKVATPKKEKTKPASAR